MRMSLAFRLSQTQRFPPTSLPLQDKVVRILRGPHGHSQAQGTSPLQYWKACGTPLRSRFSTRWWGAPAVVAGLTESDHARLPVGKALVGSGLGPFGFPEPFVLVGAQLNALRHRPRWWMFGVGSRGVSSTARKRRPLVEAVGVSTSWRTLQVFHLMLEAILSFFPVKEIFPRHPYSMECPAVSRGLSSLPSNMHGGKTSRAVAWNLVSHGVRAPDVCLRCGVRWKVLD